MKINVFYLNDERNDVTVRIMDNKYDAASGKGDLFTCLRPAEGKLFELEIPDDSTLYVKKWPNLVMISYTYLPDHFQPVEDLPRSGAV